MLAEALKSWWLSLRFSLAWQSAHEFAFYLIRKVPERQEPGHRIGTWARKERGLLGQCPAASTSTGDKGRARRRAREEKRERDCEVASIMCARTHARARAMCAVPSVSPRCASLTRHTFPFSEWYWGGTRGGTIPRFFFFGSSVGSVVVPSSPWPDKNVQGSGRHPTC